MRSLERGKAMETSLTLISNSMALTVKEMKNTRRLRRAA
jgi:hypothetical protein